MSRMRLFLWLHYAVPALCCSPPPVQIPIENALLSNGARIRGISVGLGTPPQNISMFASADNNETFIYSTNGHCDDAFSTTACFSYRGGEYDPSKSTSTSSGSQTDTSQFNATWSVDDLYLSSNDTVQGFEFGIPGLDMNSGYVSQAQLGLGRNSPLLNTLKEAGTIGSRAFSIFWGLVGGPTDQQTSGSLILGGLDQSYLGKATENFTAKLNYESTCGTGMLVTINDIALNWPNGTDTSIFMGSQSAVIQACLSPSFAGLMSLPLTFWDQFVELAGGNFPGNEETRSIGINYFTMLYEPDGVYYGDLSISLQNSISIRVPNKQLVVADEHIDSQTGQFVTNDTVRDVVINSIQDVNSKDLPVLGRLFFSSAYLSVNYDTETFSVWQVDTSGTQSVLTALDEKNEMVKEFCQNATSTDNPISSDPTNSSASVAISSTALSGGAIAGIVVGAVAGVGAVAAAAFFLVRRRRRAAAQGAPTVVHSPNKPPTPPYHSRPNLVLAELQGANITPNGEKVEALNHQDRHEVLELDGNNPCDRT